MRVLDHEPQVWFLLEEDKTLYLDANCEHSGVGYSVLIALDDAERAAYAAGGRAYLDQLACNIHYSAPGVIGSSSPFKARNLTIGPSDEAKRAGAAITAWQATRTG